MQIYIPTYNFSERFLFRTDDISKRVFFFFLFCFVLFFVFLFVCCVSVIVFVLFFVLFFVFVFVLFCFLVLNEQSFILTVFNP